MKSKRLDDLFSKLKKKKIRDLKNWSPGGNPSLEEDCIKGSYYLFPEKPIMWLQQREEGGGVLQTNAEKNTRDGFLSPLHLVLTGFLKIE